DLFDRVTAEDIAARFVRVLEAVAADPEVRLGRIGLLEPEERALIVERWAGTGGAPVRATIAERFAGVVAAAPDAVAVVCGPVALSYAQLDARARVLAGVLAGLGVGPERCVALLLPRSVELVVAVLGVVQAGGVYVPIDPAYPAERVGFMVEDAAPMVVVTVPGLRERAPAGLPVVVLDADGTTEIFGVGEPRATAEGTVAAGAGSAVAVGAGSAVAVGLRPEHPAYVIFTSGSTGRPKGVVVPQGNVVRLLDATQGWFGFGPRDVWTLFHSYAFDFSVWELWGALLSGGRLVVVPFEVSRSPGEF
ncbi:AMP-binding protein, partial [Planobispora rosea]|uniref:AMP-binding protein n=1 Tax=Planobispora rosea TaxID=35762 RepID=UPI00194381ED